MKQKVIVLLATIYVFNCQSQRFFFNDSTIRYIQNYKITEGIQDSIYCVSINKKVDSHYYLGLKLILVEDTLTGMAYSEWRDVRFDNVNVSEFLTDKQHVKIHDRYSHKQLKRLYHTCMEQCYEDNIMTKAISYNTLWIDRDSLMMIYMMIEQEDGLYSLLPCDSQAIYLKYDSLFTSLSPHIQYRLMMQYPRLYRGYKRAKRKAVPPARPDIIFYELIHDYKKEKRQIRRGLLI